jgi:hypothetical protein
MPNRINIEKLVAKDGSDEHGRAMPSVKRRVRQNF